MATNNAGSKAMVGKQPSTYPKAPPPNKSITISKKTMR